MKLPETSEKHATKPTHRVSGRLYFDSDELPNNVHKRSGRLYVIAKGETGRIAKVGIARNVRKRVKDLECANGERFPVIWISPLCVNYAYIEAKLHERMRTYRAVGEWFNVPFMIVVAMARQMNYDKVSRYSIVRSLAEAAALVKPPSG